MKLSWLLVLAASVALSKGFRLGRPNKQSCGESEGLAMYYRGNGRIVGGVEVPDCSHIPWQVRLSIGDYLCGGSIISDRHILTAAHCIYGDAPEDVIVYVGDYNMTKKDDSEEEIGVSMILQHEDYNPDTIESDIAILLLERPIQFGRCKQPVCIDSEPNFDGKECIVSGWGTTAWEGEVSDVLQMVNVTVHKGSKCIDKFKIPSWYPDYIPSNETMICGGAAGKDSCQGDSGGPLICRRGPLDFVQVGVVSFGYECANETFPGIYAHVGYFYHWIQSVMEEFSGDD